MTPKAAKHTSAAPRPVGFPPMPAGDFWNETQWAVLFALMDAAVPSMATAADISDAAGQLRISDEEFAEAFEQASRAMTSPPSAKDFKAYIGLRPTKDPLFIENFRRFAATIPPASQKKLGGLTSLLT